MRDSPFTRQEGALALNGFNHSTKRSREITKVWVRGPYNNNEGSVCMILPTVHTGERGKNLLHICSVLTYTSGMSAESRSARDNMLYISPLGA